MLYIGVYGKEGVKEMGRFIRYLLDGFDKSIIVGIPDFSQNNQYADMVNIGNDIKYAMRKVDDATRKTSTSQPLKRKSRRKGVRR